MNTIQEEDARVQAVQKAMEEGYSMTKACEKAGIPRTTYSRRRTSDVVGFFVANLMKKSTSVQTVPQLLSTIKEVFEETIGCPLTQGEGRYEALMIKYEAQSERLSSVLEKNDELKGRHENLLTTHEETLEEMDRLKAALSEAKAREEGLTALLESTKKALSEAKAALVETKSDLSEAKKAKSDSSKAPPPTTDPTEAELEALRKRTMKILQGFKTRATLSKSKLKALNAYIKSKHKDFTSLCGRFPSRYSLVALSEEQVGKGVEIYDVLKNHYSTNFFGSWLEALGKDCFIE